MRLRSSFIDHLESRRLLAASVTLSSAGALHITGTEENDPVTFGSDNIVVSRSGDKIKVSLNGKVKLYDRSNIKSLFVEGGTGADLIHVSSDVTLPTTLRGGPGADQLVGGYRRTTILTDYLDLIVDLPHGGTYKYQFEGPGHSPQHLAFEGSIDTDEDGLILITTELAGGEPAPGLGLVYVPGLTLSYTSAPDTLDFIANGHAITLDMAGGDDDALVRNYSTEASDTATLLGGNGDDTLRSAAQGNYVLYGGRGNDTLISSPDANDKLVGGPGIDTADYSARKRSLRITLDNQPNDGKTGEHDNVMADVENIIGGSSNDYLQGGPDNNSLVGGAGNDTLWGGAGDDTLNGGAGNDLLFGQDGSDLLLGKDGAKDSLDGGLGFDKATRDNGPSVFDIVKNIEAFI